MPAADIKTIKAALFIEVDGKTRLVALPRERMELLLQLAESLFDNGKLSVMPTTLFDFSAIGNAPADAAASDAPPNDAVTAMVDAAMVEMKNIHPPLRRSECERLIRAAFGVQTYASTQATNCAVCGQHKHTPLRVDKMGGYVCLTCIDKELDRLLEPPEPSVQGPAELWLQLHGDCSDAELSAPVDYTGNDVTWCWHRINDSDVRYVRADLAGVPVTGGPAA